MEDIFSDLSDGNLVKEILAQCDHEKECIDIKNQFSHIKIFKDLSGNGPRLKIVLVSSGKVKYVDPFTLEILLRIPDSVIKDFAVEH